MRGRKILAAVCGVLLIGSQIQVPGMTAKAEEKPPGMEIPDDKEEGQGSLAVTEAAVRKKEASVLSQYDFGIVADDSVIVTVTAEAITEAPVTFTLSDGQTTTDEQAEAVTADGVQGNITKYLYAAEFDVALGEGELDKEICFSCIVENNTAKADMPLPMKIEGQEGITDTLILDKKEPVVSNMDIIYDNHKKQFTAKGTMVDAESGIQSIRYRWDNQEWQEYEVSSGQPGAEVSFEDTVLYQEAENVDFRNGLHMLYFEIVDHAGILHQEHDVYCDVAEGPDTKAPVVTDIKLHTVDESALDQVLRVLTFGNYSSRALALDVKVKDQSESGRLNGVQTIELMDGSGDGAKVIQAQAGKEEEEAVYSFLLEPEQVIENWCIRITDHENYSDTKSITELLETDIDGKHFISDRWVFDAVSPEIVFSYTNEVFHNSTGAYYFNNNGGRFLISISDNTSLESAVISQVYRAHETEEGTETTIKDEQYTSETSNCFYEVDTEELDTGWYIYTAAAKDYAGNPQTVQSAKFYVDHELPEVEIAVISPTVTSIGKELWVKEQDGKGNVQPITFRLYAKQTGAEIDSIRMDINGEKNYFECSKEGLSTDKEGRTYVDITISPSELSYDANNRYEVRAVITAASKNESSAALTLHVDTEDPVINRFTVEKKNSAANTILNVLTFGVFANDSLILTAYVSDGEHDSGIDYVTISYDGQPKPIRMKRRSEGVYDFELELHTKVFQSDIVITAYDQLGKKSLSCPNIENTDRGQGVSENCFVMLETVPPVITIDLPETDSTPREDGQIWYRRHSSSENDSEKFIALTVQDVDSGIRQVEMSINGNDVAPLGGSLDRNGQPLPDQASTAAAGKRNCSRLQYYFSTEKIAEYISANQDGSYIIEVKATDNSGNVNTELIDSMGNLYSDAKAVYYRDMIEPSVVQFSFQPAALDGTLDTVDFIERLEYGYYFKQEFQVTVHAEDTIPSSQLDKVVFRLVNYQEDGPAEAILEVPAAEGKASCTIPAGFKGQVYARAYDKVGNASSEVTSKGYIIDETAPVITIEPLPGHEARLDGNGNKLYTGTVQFRVTITDTQSGLGSISYSKSSELDSYGEVVTNIENTEGYHGNTLLPGGWQVEQTDVNLITEVSQVFTFDRDDNDISMAFQAADRSGNYSGPAVSEIFTIDTIAPRVSIVNQSQVIDGMYYQGSTEFTITVTERNFNPELMVDKITNSFTAAAPEVVFRAEASNPHVYVATVHFPEGDYEFSFTGEDLGGHPAAVVVNGEDSGGYFFTTFRVDSTSPVITTNFGDFSEAGEIKNYFNSTQTAKIVVEEHNFLDINMGITIQNKAAGETHDEEGWNPYSVQTDWVEGDNGDTYILEIPFKEEGVYRIFMQPTDRVGNQGVMKGDSADHTDIFEIDTTKPALYARNGEAVENTSPFIKVYKEEDKDAPPPEVEFKDLNFDRIEVKIATYMPAYENEIEFKDLAISPMPEQASKLVDQEKFTLTEFDKDGVYALEFVAVDKAGNRSETVSDTYFRMIDKDVLAYICNSDLNDKTGYYSLMSGEGKAISKKAADFQDLDIVVAWPAEESRNGTLMLHRDKDEYDPRDYAAFKVEDEAISETAVLTRMHLPGSYFAETFRDDELDATFYLSIYIGDKMKQPLASIHIDNEPPSGNLPKGFRNWHNYLDDEVTISITGIKDTLNDDASVVYECDKDGSRDEIEHTYDKDKETFSFTLGKGLHNIDVTLVDEAGNEWNLERVRNLRVGKFRLYVGLGAAAIVIAAIIFLVRRKKKIVSYE